MRLNLPAKCITAAFLAVIFSFCLAGCKSTPPVDWNARVGAYTFDQAVTDLGPPDKQTKLSDNETVAQWITRSSGGSGFSIGTGFFSGPVGVGMSQSVGSSNPDKVLTLTFNTNYVLSAWSKNY